MLSWKVYSAENEPNYRMFNQATIVQGGAEFVFSSEGAGFQIELNEEHIGESEIGQTISLSFGDRLRLFKSNITCNVGVYDKQMDTYLIGSCRFQDNQFETIDNIYELIE